MFLNMQFSIRIVILAKNTQKCGPFEGKLEMQKFANTKCQYKGSPNIRDTKKTLQINYTIGDFM